MGLILFEALFISLGMCLLYSTIIFNNNTGFIIFCDEAVQYRAMRMNLISENTIKEKSKQMFLYLDFILLFLSPSVVHFFNKPKNFLMAFLELVLIYIIIACFDFLYSRLCIEKGCINYKELEIKKISPKINPLEKGFLYIIVCFFTSFVVTSVIELGKLLFNIFNVFG